MLQGLVLFQSRRPLRALPPVPVLVILRAQLQLCSSFHASEWTQSHCLASLCILNITACLPGALVWGPCLKKKSDGKGGSAFIKCVFSWRKERLAGANDKMLLTEGARLGEGEGWETCPGLTAVQRCLCFHRHILKFVTVNAEAGF